MGAIVAGVIEDDRARDGLRRADEEPHARVVLERALGGGPNFEPCVEARGGGVEALVGEDVAAREIEFFGAGEIERDALAEPGALDRLGMHLDRAHAHFVARGQHAELLADVDLGAHRGAGDDDAVSLDDEGAIERQAEDAGGAARLEAVELADDFGAQLLEAGAGDRRDRDDRRAVERGAVGEQFDFVAHVARGGRRRRGRPW